MDKEKLYLKLPIWLQNWAISWEGRRIKHKRYGRDFHQFLNEYEARTSWSCRQLCEMRDEKLRTIVCYCAEMVPFYRSLFKDRGIKPADIHGVEDLKAIPVLTKEMVKQNGTDMLSDAVPKCSRVMVHTSGTTGSGLQFASTDRALSVQWAVWWRYRRLHKIAIDTWCGYFGGRSIVPLSQEKPPFWRYNRPGRQIMFSGYHMNPDNMGAYIGELGRQRPPWLHGYPSLLAWLAGFILDSKAELDYKPTWITTGAENLLPQQSALIEQAFGVRPIQHYGMAEAVANISEWPDGKLRVDEDFAYVEFLPNPDGPGFKIIGTSLSNPATPLLRYDTGDIAELEEPQDPAAPGGRVVKRIDGRQEDYIVLKNGAKLGRMDHIFKDLTAIREAQLYQKTPGKIEIRVVKGIGYGKVDEDMLLKEFRKRVGGDTELHVVYLDSIPRTKSGKLRFVISDIPQSQLEGH